MADEITVNTSLSKDKDGIIVTRTFEQLVTMNGTKHNHTIQTISNSAATTIAVGEVVTNGWAEFYNTGKLGTAAATNFIQLGRTDGGTFRPFCRIEPGEAPVFRLDPSFTLQGKADTGPVDLEVLIVED